MHDVDGAGHLGGGLLAVLREELAKDPEGLHIAGAAYAAPHVWAKGQREYSDGRLAMRLLWPSL